MNNGPINRDTLPFRRCEVYGCYNSAYAHVRFRHKLMERVEIDYCKEHLEGRLRVWPESILQIIYLEQSPQAACGET